MRVFLQEVWENEGMEHPTPEYVTWGSMNNIYAMFDMDDDIIRGMYQGDGQGTTHEDETDMLPELAYNAWMQDHLWWCQDGLDAWSTDDDDDYLYLRPRIDMKRVFIKRLREEVEKGHSERRRGNRAT